MSTDPFGAGETWEQQVVPALAQARAGLEQTQRQWREAQAELAAARELGRELADLHAQALSACAERQLKATPETPPPAPLDEATVLALARWLERLAAEPPARSAPDL